MFNNTIRKRIKFVDKQFTESDIQICQETGKNVQPYNLKLKIAIRSQVFTYYISQDSYV